MTYSKRVINLNSPCQDCAHKYKCDGQRLACQQFRVFVNTGAISKAAFINPTREIYADVFYTNPFMNRKETVCE
jgi:hypothetical protein